jgi:hypothetical protein
MMKCYFGNSLRKPKETGALTKNATCEAKVSQHVGEISPG